MTTLVIEQPNYVPWLGYFDLLDRADTWVWYDDVQYTRRDWRNRNRVAGGSEPVWLSIPVRSQNHREKVICEIEIDHRQEWSRKHLNTLRHLYANAPFFEPIFDLMSRHLNASSRFLADLTVDLNEALCRALGIETVFHRSSSLEGISGTKEDRILSLCRRFRPSTYLSGPAARDYLSDESFEKEGIALRYISYEYGEYPRGGQPPRVDLSILDPLCWIGPIRTLELIRANRFEGRG